MRGVGHIFAEFFRRGQGRCHVRCVEPRLTSKHSRVLPAASPSAVPLKIGRGSAPTQEPSPFRAGADRMRPSRGDFCSRSPRVLDGDVFLTRNSFDAKMSSPDSWPTPGYRVGSWCRGVGGLSLSWPSLSVDGASVRPHARVPATPLKFRT